MDQIAVRLDMMQTLALAAVVLFIGYGIRRRVAVLDRYNIPAPVVGGFLFAALGLALRLTGLITIEFDTTLQTPLMIAFFTTIGLGASLSLLQSGRPAGAPVLPARVGAGRAPERGGRRPVEGARRESVPRA